MSGFEKIIQKNMLKSRKKRSKTCKKAQKSSQVSSYLGLFFELPTMVFLLINIVSVGVFAYIIEKKNSHLLLVEHKEGLIPAYLPTFTYRRVIFSPYIYSKNVVSRLCFCTAYFKWEVPT